MVSSKFKERVEKILSKKVELLSKIGFTPNIITIMGLFSSFISAWCYTKGSENLLFLPVASVLIIFSGFLDSIDGILARLSGGTSVFGAFLDSISDRYSDAIILSSITISGLCHYFWGLSAIIGTLMVSYARARAETLGVEMAAVGFAERAERILILSAITFAAYFRLDLLNYGVAALAVLVHITVLQRAAHFYRKITQKYN